jgi:hypothetical protein
VGENGHNCTKEGFKTGCLYGEDSEIPANLGFLVQVSTSKSSLTQSHGDGRLRLTTILSPLIGIPTEQSLAVKLLSQGKFKSPLESVSMWESRVSITRSAGNSRGRNPIMWATIQIPARKLESTSKSAGTRFEKN